MNVLTHPAFGRDAKRTAAGLTATLALTATTVAHLHAPAAARPGQVSTIVLAVAAVGLLFAPIAYATWNRGPALAAALALTPPVAAQISTGTIVASSDVVAGVLIAVLAVTIAVARSEGSERERRAPSGD